MGFGDRFRKVMGIPVNPDPVALRLAQTPQPA